MAEHLIEVLPRDPGTDPASRSILSEAQHLGADGLISATASKLYKLTGALSDADARKVTSELLTDPVTESNSSNERPDVVIDVWYKAGVTDPAAWTIEQALSAMGYAGVKVRCGSRNRFFGATPERKLAAIAGKFLGNAVMQEWEVRCSD